MRKRWMDGWIRGIYSRHVIGVLASIKLHWVASIGLSIGVTRGCTGSDQL